MENIKLAVDEHGIALIELNRPASLNALNAPLLREVREALAALQSDQRTRALIITGSGRAFCAGADLGVEMLRAQGGERPTIGEAVAREMAAEFNPMMEMLYDFPRPVVTAINGIAAGGGAGLALCADVALASDSAGLRVVQPQQLGIAGDLGINWLLVRLGGRARALGMCLLGDTIPAATLKQWGLVWDCVAPADLMGSARETARRLADIPPDTVLATRRLVDAGFSDSYGESLAKERVAQKTLCDLPVFLESVRKFRARR
jgi:2-(1,2-epoxy-1,2-dihydrophenyl)acetyl-CoA isomerase